MTFALKPWVRVGRFEYHEPYNPNIFFFHLQRGQSHFVGHFLIRKCPRFHFLSPDPCLLSILISFSNIGNINLKFLLFSLCLITYFWGSFNFKLGQHWVSNMTYLWNLAKIGAVTAEILLTMRFCSWCWWVAVCKIIFVSTYVMLS